MDYFRSKTWKSSENVTRGTLFSIWSYFFNGFPGFWPNFQLFWSRNVGSYSKLRKKRKFLRCCWSSAPWKEMDSPSVCYRSTRFLGILHPRITVFLGFPWKGNAILVLFWGGQKLLLGVQNQLSGGPGGLEKPKIARITRMQGNVELDGI